MAEASLLPLFAASISPDTQTRQDAENQLSQIEATPGVLSSTLTLVAQGSSGHDDHGAARMSAAVFLKNAVIRGWQTSTSTRPIPDGDRDFIRSHLLEALVHAQRPIKPTLTALLGQIIPSDFPQAWPNLVQQSTTLLRDKRVAGVETGLLALLALMRKYRWSRTGERSTLDEAIAASLPTVLVISQRALAGELSSLQPPAGTAAEAQARSGQILYLSLKVYKMSVTTELSAHQQENIVPWGQLLLQVVQKRMSGVEGVPEDPDDRAKYGWFKAKKWAYHNLNRLMQRYGRPTMLTKNMEQYRPFATRFISYFAPEILKTYLQQVELYLSQQEWLSNRIICHILTFFEESVKPKETWTLLRPHLNVLVDRFVFPLLCVTEEEVSEFNDEPADYVRSHFGEFVDGFFTAPSTAATSFVLGLASGRKKAVFMTLLNFVNGVCSKYPAERSAVEKDGALRMLAHLSSVITETKSLQDDIEKFFVAYVFPEFQSEHAFLRCRAFEVVQKFEVFNSDWTDVENLHIVYRGVMGGMMDPALPVRVQAALALPDLVEYEQVRDQLANNIREVIQELLKLSNEVDLDSLTNVTRVLVSNFSDELLPFALDLTRSLQLSYIRIMNDISEGRKQPASEDADEEGEEEKTLAAMNILKTMQQIVVGLEANVESLKAVESVCLSAISFTLREEYIELFDETFELLDTLQFALKTVSADQWALFELICELCRGIGIDFLGEMFPSLDNYITYGSATFSSNPVLMRKIFEVFQMVMTNASLGCSDRVTGMKIADCALYSVRGSIDEGVPLFIEHAMSVVNRGITTEEPVITKALLMHSIETILNAIHYRADLALRILNERGWLVNFFTSWFHHLSSLTRSHDKKLAILAICCVFRTTVSEPTDSVIVQSAGQLLVGALALFDGFPASLQRRLETEDEYGSDSSDASSETTEEGEDEAEDEDADLGDDYVYADADDPTVSSSGRRSTSTETASEAWSDEVLWETPFDLVDVYKQFQETIQGLEAGAPQVLAVITSHINEAQRHALQQVLNLASTGGEAAVKEQARLRIAADADLERPT